MRKRYLQDWIDALRAAIATDCNVIVIAQTNGTLLDNEWIDLFFHNGVRLGIALDGPREFHDRYRITKKGSGTFDVVMQKLQLLRDHPRGHDVFGSVLSVANPDIPPGELWDTWISTGFTRFDFNLPHCSHDAPPWFTNEKLAAWLIELFNIWWRNDNPGIDVRFFRNIVHLLLGATSATDYIGGTQVGILVIETDGSLNGTDALRACADGLIDIGMNVFDNDIQEPMSIPLVRDCNHGAAVLSALCKTCPVHEVCGGGYFPHRYSAVNGYDNPSAYCSALFAIINHIRDTMVGAGGKIFTESFSQAA